MSYDDVHRPTLSVQYVGGSRDRGIPQADMDLSDEYLWTTAAPFPLLKVKLLREAKLCVMWMRTVSQVWKRQGPGYHRHRAQLHGAIYR